MATASQMVSVLATISVLMAHTTNAQEYAPRFAFILTQADRNLIAAALAQKKDGPLHILDKAKYNVEHGFPVTDGDFMVINGALMLCGDSRAPELLMRLRSQLPNVRTPRGHQGSIAEKARHAV
jgi:hypothetical protein